MTETVSKNFQQWTGDGVTTDYTLSNVTVLDETHLAVYIDETIQSIATDYTVEIEAQVATVTFLTPPTADRRISIVREEPLEQNTDLTTVNSFRAEGFEGALDSIVRQIFRLWHRLTRSITLPDSDIDGSGQYDANGNRLGNLGDPTADQDAVTKLYADGRYALQSGGGGDMFKASYDSNNDGKVNAADSADTVPWSGVTGKPSTFAPEAHTHTGADVTDLAAVATSGSYNDLANKPAIPTVDDTAYAASWNGNTDAPTKNAVYDKIETLGGGGGSSIAVEDEGVGLTTAVTKINFVGSGVTATEPVADEITVTVAGGGAPVDSVNAQTGVVVIDPDDLDDTLTTHKFTTAGEASKLAGIETAADVTDAANVGSSIHGASAKTTPVDADTIPLIDSAASNALKKLTWANLKATAEAYFDTLYQAIDADTAKTDVAQTFTAAQGITPVALSDGASIATNAALSNVFTVTLGGNRALANPTNLVAGRVYTWIITHSNRSLTYGSYFDFRGDALALSSGTNRVEILTGIAVSTTKIYMTGKADAS